MADQRNKRVYISTRRHDTETTFVFASEIQKIVGSQSFWHRGDHELRDSWTSELRRVLHDSYAMVLLIGPNWLKAADEYGRRLLDDPSDVVRLEIETAIELGVHIIPILPDGVSMPPAHAFPDSLKGLAELRYIRADPNADWHRKLRGVLHQTRKGTFGSQNKTGRLDYEISSIELINFKCFEQIEIDLSTDSILEGNWTCIAGINGAGKSTILQALALVLMGPSLASEIGGRRIQSFRRVDPDGKAMLATVKANIHSFDNEYVTEIVIDDDGLRTSSFENYRHIQNSMFAGYGASRNVSSNFGRRDNLLSPGVDRFISLFDPMTPLNSAETIFQRAKNKSVADRREFSIFKRLIDAIFPNEITLKLETGSERPLVRFRSNNAAHEVSGLPDGYRSSVAWIADLAVCIAELNPFDKQLKPSKVSGIVLIDEIELHLHASLQRSIVARLRKAMPKIQWIVTTHSPLVISSFDQREIIALDEELDRGFRELDRQVLGLTADQVYEYLYGTPPTSSAGEDHIETLSGNPGRFSELDSLLEGSSEGITSERLDQIQSRLGRIRREKN